MSEPVLCVGDRRIGGGSPCYVIAEAGVNHNGRVDAALRMIDVAADSGADAVKFQTFDAEALVTASARKAEYQAQHTGAGESQQEMLKALSLPPDAYRRLQDHATARGILFMSTPFEEGSAALLRDLGMPLFKIPSGEITNLPFLRHVAAFGRPMVISTGMSTLADVDIALRAVRDVGLASVALLHCVSAYPASPADANLRAIHTLRAAFSVPVGFSDHTLGTTVALAAVALGADLLEKHFTLDRTLPGPDHQASLEPTELREMITQIRQVESALGTGVKEPCASEADTAAVARKSLVAARDLPAGAVVDADAIAIKRPGVGLSPVLRDFVIGRRLRATLQKDDLLRLEDLE